MDGVGHGTPPDAIRRVLRRILESPAFEASERNRRFLEYVVEETLAGRAGRIKAYCIATEVFGRPADFDPQVDPIVRIEAGRLRRGLDRYYLTAGSADPVRISIPKGSYVPVFAAAPAAGDEEAGGARPDDAKPVPPEKPGASDRPRSFRRHRPALLAAAAALAVVVLAALAWFGAPRPAAVPVSGVAHRDGPAIFVLPFAEEGSSAAFPDFAKGFTREVIVALTRFNDLFVFGPQTSFGYGAETDVGRVVSELDVNLVLTGGVSVSGGGFTIHATLMDARSGEYLWAQRFDGRLDGRDILAARNEVANKVARALAQPYGVIFADQAADSEGRPPAELSSYECVIRFELYWKALRRSEFQPVRACLERVIAGDPGYAEAFAALSLVYSDAYRFGFGEGGLPADPRQTALRLAQKAIELAPDSARAYQALSLALWLLNDVGGSLEAARTGLALNPNDTELMALLGTSYILRNDRERGRALVVEAFARNPGQPSWYRLELSLDDYFSGRYEQALSEARQIDAPKVIYGHLAVALAAAALGRMDEAHAAVGRILAIDPHYGDHVVADITKRNLHPDLIPRVIAGLRKAGLTIPGDHG